MSTSFSRSFSDLLLVPLLLTVGCASPSKEGGWVRSEGTAEGGFTVMMPVPNGEQEGTLWILGDSITSHIAIANDSGITYVAAYFDLPDTLAAATETERAAAVWNMLGERIGAQPLAEAPPLGEATATSHSAWFVDPKEVRLAVAVHLRGSRVVILNSASPEKFTGAPQRDKMLRFLRSIEFTP